MSADFLDLIDWLWAGWDCGTFFAFVFFFLVLPSRIFVFFLRVCVLVEFHLCAEVVLELIVCCEGVKPIANLPQAPCVIGVCLLSSAVSEVRTVTRRSAVRRVCAQQCAVVCSPRRHS